MPSMSNTRLSLGDALEMKSVKDNRDIDDKSTVLSRGPIILVGLMVKRLTQYSDGKVENRASTCLTLRTIQENTILKVFDTSLSSLSNFGDWSVHTCLSTP